MAAKKDAPSETPAPSLTLEEAFTFAQQMVVRVRVFEQLEGVLAAAIEAKNVLASIQQKTRTAEADLATVKDAHAAAEKAHAEKIEALTAEMMAKATKQSEDARATLEGLAADIEAALKKKRDAVAAADAAEQGAAVRIERAEMAAMEAEGKAAKIQETLAGLKAQIGA